MTTLLLARHGETDWNRELRIQGSSDIALNDLGRRLRQGEVGLHVQALADSGRAAAAVRDDPGAFGDESPRRLEADASGRAGDEARLPLQSQIHGRLA